MTYKQINAMIAGIGLDYAYYEFPDATPTAPPFICFFYGDSDDLYADGINYQRITTLYIEFYSDAKDFAHETAIENTLTAHGLTYSKAEQFLDTEHMHITVYDMEVLINAE